MQYVIIPGPGNVKKEAFGTEKRDKDADKDEDKNLASENSRLKKGIKFISDFFLRRIARFI